MHIFYMCAAIGVIINDDDDDMRSGYGERGRR